MAGRGAFPYLFSILAVMLVAFASMRLGTVSVNFQQALVEWRADSDLGQAPNLGILLYQRLPRTLTALIVGAALGLVGCAFQAMLRNPLATPYTLGIASAAAFGAWFGTIVLGGLGIAVASPFLRGRIVELSAFVFAAGEAAIVYAIAARSRRASPAVLLLAGVTLGMLANAGIMLLRYFASPETYIAMDRWLLGGVDVLGYAPVISLLVATVPCALILLSQATILDQLAFGHELATGRGVRVERAQARIFITGSILTAFLVANVGPIGFAGLIVPHIARMLFGARHTRLMPLSMLFGAAFLCGCDVLARVLFPHETPIGILTALLGGPFFLALLLRGKLTDWTR